MSKVVARWSGAHGIRMRENGHICRHPCAVGTGGNARKISIFVLSWGGRGDGIVFGTQTTRPVRKSNGGAARGAVVVFEGE